MERGGEGDFQIGLHLLSLCPVNVRQRSEFGE
jgi:hypothetical protein